MESGRDTGLRSLLREALASPLTFSTYKTSEAVPTAQDVWPRPFSAGPCDWDGQCEELQQTAEVGRFWHRTRGHLCHLCWEMFHQRETRVRVRNLAVPSP